MGGRVKVREREKKRKKETGEYEVMREMEREREREKGLMGPPVLYLVAETVACGACASGDEVRWLQEEVQRGGVELTVNEANITEKERER